MAALTWATRQPAIFLAVTHLIVGAVLMWLVPTLRLFMTDQRRDLDTLHPLLFLIAVAFLTTGTMILGARSAVFPVLRWLHLIWLFVVGIAAALGLVLFGLVLLVSGGRGFSGQDSPASLGVFVTANSSLLLFFSIMVLVTIREWREGRCVVSPASSPRQIIWTIAATVFCLGFIGASYSWQTRAARLRTAAEQQAYNQELQNYTYDRGNVSCLAFSPNGEFLATAAEFDYSQSGLRLWEVSSGKLLREFAGGFQVLSLAFSPDGRQLVSGYQEQWNTGGFVVIDTVTGNEQFRYRGGRVESVAISPSGELLLAAVNAGSNNRSETLPFTIWDVANWQTVFESKPSVGYDLVTFSADGSHFAAHRRDAIEIWSLPGEQGPTIQLTFDPHLGGVSALSFLANNQRLAAANSFESRSWNVTELQNSVKPEPTTLSREVTSVEAFSPDGTLLVNVSQQQSVTAIDLQTAAPIHQYQAPFWTTAIAISPQNDLVALGGNRTVLIVDAKTGKTVHTLAQQNRP